MSQAVDIEAAARQIGIDAAQACVGRDPFDVARSLGVSVEWTDADHVVAGLRMRAHYDQDSRRIVLYRRGIDELGENGEAVTVAHELFHHLAAIDAAIARRLSGLSRRHRGRIEEIAAREFAGEWCAR